MSPRSHNRKALSRFFGGSAPNDGPCGLTAPQQAFPDVQNATSCRASVTSRHRIALARLICKIVCRIRLSCDNVDYGAVSPTQAFKQVSQQYRSKHTQHPILPPEQRLALAVTLAFAVSAAPLAARTASPQPCTTQACVQLEARVQQGPSSVHLEAIELARGGDFNSALERLRLLRNAHPGELAYAGDYAVVLAWSGRDAEALEQLPHLGAAPAYVNETLAKSARNLRRYDLARDLYQAVLRSAPQGLEAHAGLVMTLADAGRLELALKEANSCVVAFARQSEAHLARAYVNERKGALVDALTDYERALALSPRDNAAKRARALIIARLGAPQLALEHANAAPDAFSAQDLRRMRGDVSATLVRWGEMRDGRDPERFKETDAALAQLSPESTSHLDGEDALRARFDRIVALRDRVRMQDVINEYRKLQQENIELPTYVATAAADALLYLERPEEARDLYAKSLRVDPRNAELTQSFFYAQVDTDDFPAAFLTIDKHLESMPGWRARAGVQGANWDKLEADRLAALARAYTDMYAQAYSRLSKLADDAPMNTDVRQARADVARWRGWPRQAQQEYVTVLRTLDPDHVGTRIGRAEALLALRRYPEAQNELLALYKQFPENKAIQNLYREWALHNMNEVRAEYNFGKHTDSPGGSREHQLDLLVTSRPISYHWRAFAHGALQRASLASGNSELRHLGAGAEYAKGDVRVRGEVSNNDAVKDATGFSLEGEYWVNDQWSLGGDYEKSSIRVPLQARAAGVDGNAYSAWAQYRASELTRVRVGLAGIRFDDGNDRTEASLTLARRLVTRPYYHLTLNASLYGSHNSEEDRPYFNPKNNSSAELELENRWRVWRRYDKSFNHTLGLSIGTLQQSGFSNEPIGGVRYEHNWRFNDRLGLDYGISYNRRVYDGAKDDGLGAHVVLNTLF